MERWLCGPYFPASPLMLGKKEVEGVAVGVRWWGRGRGVGKLHQHSIKCITSHAQLLSQTWSATITLNPSGDEQKAAKSDSKELLHIWTHSSHLPSVSIYGMNPPHLPTKTKFVRFKLACLKKGERNYNYMLSSHPKLPYNARCSV